MNSGDKNHFAKTMRKMHKIIITDGVASPLQSPKFQARNQYFDFDGYSVTAMIPSVC